MRQEGFQHNPKKRIQPPPTAKCGLTTKICVFTSRNVDLTSLTVKNVVFVEIQSHFHLVKSTQFLVPRSPSVQIRTQTEQCSHRPTRAPLSRTHPWCCAAAKWKCWPIVSLGQQQGKRVYLNARV